MATDGITAAPAWVVGVGGVTGTMSGVLFLGVLQNGLPVAGLQDYWQQIVTGLILIGVIATDRAQRTGWVSLTLARHRERRNNNDNGGR
jgi:ribose/xylose/arabinose/galactoside ABC-type transport system permease subunit